MKTFALVVVGMVLAAFVEGANAQTLAQSEGQKGFFAPAHMYRDLNLGRVEKNFMGALEFFIDGPVECAIAQLAMLKLVQPECQSDALKEKIDDLSVRGRTAAIRYKAYLTSMVFDQPAIFAEEGTRTYDDGEQLFAALAHRLETMVLASSR